MGRTFLASLLMVSMVALARGHASIFDFSSDGGASKARAFGFRDDVPLDSKAPDTAQGASAICRTAEMEKNRVNGCGRTELLSNIDVAEETEQALKDNTFAKVKAGDTLQGLMHVVNRDGGGNNKCTLDETNNAGQFVKEVDILQDVGGNNGLFNSTETPTNVPFAVKLPADLNCKGGSSGNMCTLRCINTSVAGPFCSCVALQQTDTKATSLTNPDQIRTQDSPEKIDKVLRVMQDNLEEFKEGSNQGNNEKDDKNDGNKGAGNGNKDNGDGNKKNTGNGDKDNEKTNTGNNNQNEGNKNAGSGNKDNGKTNTGKTNTGNNNQVNGKKNTENNNQNEGNENTGRDNSPGGKKNQNSRPKNAQNGQSDQKNNRRR